jgi:hypothetical protein
MVETLKRSAMTPDAAVFAAKLLSAGMVMIPSVVRNAVNVNALRNLRPEQIIGHPFQNYEPAAIQPARLIGIHSNGMSWWNLSHTIRLPVTMASSILSHCFQYLARLSDIARPCSPLRIVHNFPLARTLSKTPTNPRFACGE